MSNVVPLPIDVIPCTQPPQFKWKYRLGDGVLQDCRGSMPASAESAIINLIAYVKELQQDNNKLRAELEVASKKTK